MVKRVRFGEWHGHGPGIRYVTNTPRSAFGRMWAQLLLASLQVDMADAGGDVILILPNGEIVDMREGLLN